MNFRDRIAVLLELEGVNKFASEMGRAGDAGDKNLGKVDDRLNKLGGRMQTAGAGMLAFAGVAVGALAGFARASEEAEAESRKLDQALANSAQLAGESRQPFEELAEKIQDTTRAEGDAVLGIEAMLATWGRSKTEILELTPLIVDLARYTGKDLTSAARLVNGAWDGSTGRLEKLIGQMQEGESVTDALARTVGGFAEREAQSLAGQLEILRNNLGDVAEGIGTGVISAVNNLIGPVQSAVDWFTNLDEETQKSVGSLATYGAAVIGAAGAASFIIGSLIKMRTNFREARDAISGFLSARGGVGGISSALRGMIVPIGGATLAIGAFAAAMQWSSEMAKRDGERIDFLADQLTRLAGEATAGVDALRAAVQGGDLFGELALDADDFNAMLADLGITVDDLATKLGSGGANVIEEGRWRSALTDAAEAAGYSEAEVHDLNTSLDVLKERMVEAADASRNQQAVLGESADATGHLGDETDETSEKIQSSTEIVQAHEAAIRDLTDSIKEAHNELVRGTDLQADWEESLDKLTESIGEHGVTLDLDTEAGRANYRAGRDVADGLVELMQRRFQETGSIAQAIGAGGQYVEQLKDQLRQSGLTEEQVQSYIDTLGLTPEVIGTQFKLDTAEAVRQLQELQRLAAGVGAGSHEVEVNLINRTAKASGGIVPGSGSGDTTPLWATPGEYVIRKRAAQALGYDTLAHLNQADRWGGFAGGGMVGFNATPLGQARRIGGTPLGIATLGGLEVGGDAEAALERLVGVYRRLAAAAGEAAAENALFSAESADHFEKLAEEAEQSAERMDNAYEVGDKTTDEYLAELHRRLSGTERYSDEWKSIWQKIKQVTEDRNREQQRLEDEFRDMGLIGNKQWRQILEGRLAQAETFSADWFKVMDQIEAENEARLAEWDRKFAPYQDRQRKKVDDLTNLYLDATREAQRTDGDRQEIIARMLRERQAATRLEEEAQKWARRQPGVVDPVEIARAAAAWPGPNGQVSTVDPVQWGNQAAKEFAKALTPELLKRLRAA